MHTTDVGTSAYCGPKRRERILIVDDGLITRVLAQALLERADYTVDVADDGAEALAAVCREDREYDLLLMDLDMPVLDGYAAAAAIRALPDDRGAMPILAFTALSVPDEISRVKACGMDGHIGKPFDPAQLSHSIRHCISEWLAARLARRSTAAAATAPVWNQQVFRELGRRLNPAKIETAVLLFEQCVLRARDLLRTQGTDAGAIAFQAHNLIPAAGMMGFEDLCEVAQRAQTTLRGGTTQDAEGGHRISVSDNGIGVPAQYAEAIFGSFVRVPSQGNHGGGVGLGLGTCRRIADLHGWGLALDTGYEGGARFCVTIPAPGSVSLSRLGSGPGRVSPYT